MAATVRARSAVARRATPDEDLPGQGHVAVSGEDGRAGGRAASAAVAHDGDAGSVDLEVSGVTGEPGQTGAHVFGQAGAAGRPGGQAVSDWQAVRTAAAAGQSPRAGAWASAARAASAAIVGASSASSS
jgi:hypothetical protein